MSKTILVIDDDQDTLDLIEIILNEKGYQVIASRFGNNVDEVSKIQPDLILMDDWLADTKGHYLCKILKTDPFTRNIPIVLISAALGLKQITIDCMADNYIEKPFDIAYLCEVIASFLVKKNA